MEISRVFECNSKLILSEALHSAEESLPSYLQCFPFICLYTQYSAKNHTAYISLAVSGHMNVQIEI